MSKLKIGIVGATGYTGSELTRILLNHPEAEIIYMTSESYEGKYFTDVQPQFKGIFDTKLISSQSIEEYAADVVFLALPHGVSMNFVKLNYDSDFKIIDLSGDFRLSSKRSYESWYKMPHIYEKGISKAVYGMPELNRESIKNAHLVANPGCYPTSAILGVFPLLRKSLVEANSIIIDAKSGVTGAGAKAKQGTMYTSVSENFKAYSVKSHRHTIEIEEVLSARASERATVQFTPHLLPIDRGILSTIYMQPIGNIDIDTLRRAYADAYKDEPFVRLQDSPPETKNVRGTNFIDIFSTFDERTRRIITVTAIDNLVKGASGQAVHNMNIMFGLDETTSLNFVPLNP